MIMFLIVMFVLVMALALWAAPTAVRRQGMPEYLDHTPAADITAGDVVVIGARVLVADRAIPANTKGALACCGVYQMPKSTAGGSAIAAHTKVYWDAAVKQITTNAAAGANKQVGYTVLASVDADATQEVFLQSA